MQSWIPAKIARYHDAIHTHGHPCAPAVNRSEGAAEGDLRRRGRMESTAGAPAGGDDGEPDADASRFVDVTSVDPLPYGDGAPTSTLRVLCAEDNMFERAAVAQLFGSTNENYRAGKLPLQLAVQIVPSIDGVLRSVGEAPDKFHIILLDVNLDRGQTSEQLSLIHI